MTRPSWEQYFKEILFNVSKRSTCLRRNVGAIAIQERRIIATGYNGQMTGTPHCKVCLRETLKVPSGQRHEICLAVHAEQNLIAQSAKFGSSIDNSLVLITHKPCVICFKLLWNSGVRTILYYEDYPDDIVDNLIVSTSSKIFHYNNFNLITSGNTNIDTIF